MGESPPTPTRGHLLSLLSTAKIDGCLPEYSVIWTRPKSTEQESILPSWGGEVGRVRGGGFGGVGGGGGGGAMQVTGRMSMYDLIRGREERFQDSDPFIGGLCNRDFMGEPRGAAGAGW